MKRDNYILSEEHRKKMSEAHRGVKRTPLSEEHKRKISESMKGKNTWAKGRNISETHKDKISKAFRGERHPNWRGGVTPEHIKIRNSIEGKLWRQSVFARDGYTCQKTGIRGGGLVAHHIRNFSNFPELRFAIDNGITLSKVAHRDFHKKYGIKNNTPEQLEKFLEEV